MAYSREVISASGILLHAFLLAAEAFCGPVASSPTPAAAASLREASRRQLMIPPSGALELAHVLS